MEIEETDQVRLAQSTQLIEAHSEYLTLVRSLASHKARAQNATYLTLETYMENYAQSKVKLNFEQLCQLVVELGYFLFSCKNFAVKPLIEVSEIRVEEGMVRGSQKRFVVVVFYKLEEGEMKDMEGLTLFGGILEHIQTNLAPVLQNRQPSQKDPDQLHFDSFMQQYKKITSCSFYQSNQPFFFQALQQTNMFYQYSMLYRIKNCSILDLIQSSADRMKLFKEYQNRDQKLLLEYNQERKKNRNDNQALRNKEKLINCNFLQFFQTINPHFSQGSPLKNQKESNKISFRVLLQEKPKQEFQSYLSALDRNQDMMAQESKPIKLLRPLSEMDFFIEYSPERNIICVRLMMASMVVNVDTSDFLMFQSNVLTFEAVNVSIELSQPKMVKSEGSRPLPKVVTFKGTSSFNVKEPPFQKILLLMDITMIASRIYEPELNPMKYGQSKDHYYKLATISKKVTHYTKLFMRCAKKIYSQ